MVSIDVGVMETSSNAIEVIAARLDKIGESIETAGTTTETIGARIPTPKGFVAEASPPARPSRSHPYAEGIRIMGGGATRTLSGARTWPASPRTRKRLFDPSPVSLVPSRTAVWCRVAAT